MKWVNVPFPMKILVGLLLGTYLQIRFSQKLFSPARIGAVAGWPLIAVGVWISLKASLEIGDLIVESPAKLLTTGFYARSRNPMVVGWTLLHLGIALAANLLWIMAFLPLAIFLTRLVDIHREERRHLTEFPVQYLE